MTWIIPGMERRDCPREYQAHVERIGGMNRFGGPNFRIVWGMNETMLVYGVDANGKKGQHVVLKHGGIPAWFIECWKPPECFGTPELWYSLTWNWETDAPAIGEYPWCGLYEPANFNLFTRRFEGDKMHIDAMPLAHWLIDLLIPNIIKDLDTTYEQRKNAIRNRLLAERQRANQLAFDAYLDAGLAFGGRAGTHESNHERWAERIKAKQAGMRISRDEIVRQLGLGHRQRSR